MSRLKDVMKVTTVKGPWFSLGFHVDFQKRYVDLHLLWWIVTIGRDYYGPDTEQALVPFTQTAVPYEPVPPIVTTGSVGEDGRPAWTTISMSGNMSRTIAESAGDKEWD